MPIQDSDLFLIEEPSGVSKKIEASKLKANLATGTYDNYKLLVNKPDFSSKFVYAQNMQGSVAPTDFMMVERSDVSYKVTGQEIINFFPSVPAGLAGPITDTEQSTNYVKAVIGTPDSYYTADKAFDGNITGSYGDGAKPATGTSLVWNTSLLPAVPTGSVLKLYVYAGMGFAGGEQLVINGQEYVFPGPSDLNKIVEHDLTVGGAPGPLNTIKWTYTNSGTNYCYLKGIEIDGNLLIDNIQQITLASDANLDEFVNGDTINMVDIDGALATYVPVTGTIANVGTFSPSYVSGVDSVNGATLTNPQDLFLNGIFNSVIASRSGAGSGVRWTAANSGAPISLAAGTAMEVETSSGVTVRYKMTGNGVVTITTNSPGIQPWTLSGSGILEYIEVVMTTSATSVTWSYISVDGIILLDDTQITLTLTNDQDLKYFKPGDVVQQELPGTEAVYTDDPNGFNPSYPASNITTAPVTTFALLSGVSSVYTFEFNIKVFDASYGGSVWAWWDGTGANNYYFQVLYQDGSEGPKIFANWSGYQELNAGNTKLIRAVRSGTTSGTPTMFGLSFDGTNQLVGTFPDRPGKPTITIRSTDTTANKMTVNGGAWTGSDGTSSGDAADRETEVTGPYKSGQGNFNGNTGPVVDLTNSNGDWIDNQNRLGENFYIKAASTRTGLAVLREKAVAAADKWLTKMQYEQYSFVTYRGHYWVNTSADASDPPSEKSDNWIDLGSVSA